MTEGMTKTRLLHELRSARAEWDALMAEIGEERMTEPGATGYWSVKDVMDHITSYARWYVNAFEAHLRGELVPFDGAEMLPLEERNQFYYQKTKDLPLAASIAASREVHEGIMRLVETSSEAFLIEPQHFLGAPAPIIVWQPLQSEVYDHCRAHMRDLRAWLAQSAVK